MANFTCPRRFVRLTGQAEIAFRGPATDHALNFSTAYILQKGDGNLGQC